MTAPAAYRPLRAARRAAAPQEPALLPLARAALLAPLPAGYTVHLDAAGNEFFCCTATRTSTYEHPLDGHFRELAARQRRQQP